MLKVSRMEETFEIKSKEADRRSPLLTRQKKMCLSNETIPPPKKTVTFKEDKLEELIEFEDDDESKAARKCYWEFMAVDRFRFRDRIFKLENLLSPILEKSHRNMVYHRSRTSLTTSLSSTTEMVQVQTVVVSVTTTCGKTTD